MPRVEVARVPAQDVLQSEPNNDRILARLQQRPDLWRQLQRLHREEEQRGGDAGGIEQLDLRTIDVARKPVYTWKPQRPAFITRH